MPLFMALVGFFSTKLPTLNWREVLKKKSVQLLLPALSFSIIFALLLMCGGKLGFGFFKNYVFNSFWFLKSAFICCILYYIAVRCFRNKTVGYFVTLIMCLAIPSFKVNDMYPCFLLGVWLHNNYDLVKSRAARFALISGAIFLVMLLFWGPTFWHLPSDILKLPSAEMPRALAVLGIKYSYKLIIGLVGTVFFFSLIEYLAKRFSLFTRKTKLVAVGAETLGIYILQAMILETVMARYVNFDGYNFYLFNFIIAPALSILVLLACLPIIHLIKSTRVSAFLLLGRTINKT